MRVFHLPVQPSENVPAFRRLGQAWPPKGSPDAGLALLHYAHTDSQGSYTSRGILAGFVTPHQKD